jgi:uncharacterized protein DUF4337
LELHETSERIERAEQAHHHERKRAALLIIVLAVALAIVEMASKEAQFASLALNIQSSDIYAFFQAKTIRGSVLRTAVESMEALSSGGTEQPAIQKQVAAWRGEIERLDSDPSTREGRKQLLERAKSLEAERDAEERSYHQFEYAAAGLQLAIVIASAAVITEVVVLEVISAALGIAGLALAVLGWLDPAVVRFF